ncbi:MAG: hypothetical protein WKF30_04540 [Pyrinomonadaceae bacterium]
MHRFPVLVWEDLAGFFTARLIDDQEDDCFRLRATAQRARGARAAQGVSRVVV